MALARIRFSSARRIPDLLLLHHRVQEHHPAEIASEPAKVTEATPNDADLVDLN
jgi:hypothetical protein